MRIGIYLPQIGPEASQTRVVETAQAAEAAGFDSIWVLDHVVLREEYGTPYPYAESGRLPIPTTANLLEPLILLTYAAAVTKRIALGTAVLVLPMQAAVLHAKMLAHSIIWLAAAVLGINGLVEGRIRALSIPFAQRGKRMDEYARC
jgi:alkanesulfonate monooxygenase SsuD/methylene tetrahydromethanopterin reductase-like flavin-dependent oxidoreductase (luciferase family)